MTRFRRLAPLVLAVLVAAGCADTHPNHDGQISCSPRGQQNVGLWTAANVNSCPPPTFNGKMVSMMIGGKPVVILIGGEWLGLKDTDRNYGSSDTWMWDGSSWTLLHPATSPPALVNSTLTYDPVHNQVVFFGGENFELEQSGLTYTFDGTNWTNRTDSSDLTNHAHTPPARSAAMMAYDAADGGVLLYGGRLADDAPTDDVWLWDGTTWTNKQAASTSACDMSVTPCERMGGAMAPDPATGGVVLFGGDGASTPALADTWVWKNNAWTKKSPATSPEGRTGAAFAQLDAQTDMLFDGLHGDTWTWDGSDWTSLAQAPSPRRGAAMALLAATSSRPAQMVVFGGAGPVKFTEFDVYDDTWWYESGSPSSPPPSTANWTELQAHGVGGTSQPSGRNEAAMATFFDQSTGTYDAILFGGAPTAGATPLGDTWLWDGSSWSLVVADGAGPPARTSASMAWDNSTNTIVLFGGKDGSSPPANLSDTWIFDPTTLSWTQAAPATSPSARRQAAMASDIVDQGVMLFGGTNSSGTLDDTWIWDGFAGTWTQKSVSGPPSRSEAVLGINPGASLATEGVMLFGGNHFASGVTTILGDTWTWDGTTWTQQSLASSPSARFESAMASLDTVDVLFGGEPASGTTLLSDTWEWDGASWSQMSTTTAPAARSNAVMTGAQTSASDPTVNALLFGGSPASVDNDTWGFKP